MSAPVGGGELLLDAVLAAVTALPPACDEDTAQNLLAAVRAAVAAPPSVGADMSAMVGWGEPLLAALWAAMSVPPLPPGDKPMAVPPSTPAVELAVLAAVAVPPSPPVDASAAIGREEDPTGAPALVSARPWPAAALAAAVRDDSGECVLVDPEV